MALSPLERLRAVCLALPHAHEVEAWGTPTFRIKNKIFAMYASPGTHHGVGRHGVWLHCAAENQRAMIDAEPARYFVPPYFGPKGWLGVWIDKRPRWREADRSIEDAYQGVRPNCCCAQPFRASNLISTRAHSGNEAYGSRLSVRSVTTAHREHELISLWSALRESHASSACAAPAEVRRTGRS